MGGLRRISGPISNRQGSATFPSLNLDFDLYSDLEVEAGYLGVAIVEYDETSREVPLIEKRPTLPPKTLGRVA